MLPIDIMHGFLAGLLSFLSPETLLLFPVMAGAAGATNRASVIGGLAGAGLSLVLSGMAAVTLGASFGLDAIWLRRIVGGLLVAHALILMSQKLSDRFSWFTGGASVLGFERRPGLAVGGVFRQFLLALLVAANWLPRLTPLLAGASMAAADGRDVSTALEILFAFGLGAALPWVVLGRFIRLVIGAQAAEGMMGKAFLALALLVVAGLGLSGFDQVMTRAIDQITPQDVRDLVVKY